MTVQWKRKIKLVVGLSAGKEDALDFSEFRIRFVVKQQMTETPASAEIYIYNVSIDTAKKFDKEGQSVLLQAGYEENCDTIFKGTVRQIIFGRESPTDTFLCILASSGDLANKYAIMNETIGAGWSPSTAQSRMMESMSEYGLTMGYSPKLPDLKMPRGKVFYGMTRDYLSDFVDTHSMQWAYDNDQVIFTTTKDPLPGEAIVVRSDTGMLGMPRQTLTGVYVTCLLNPELKRGKQIKIDNSSIQKQLYDLSYQGQSNNVFISESALDADGYYKIQSAEFSGDTRGETWQVLMCCTGIDATQPVSGPTINAVG